MKKNILFICILLSGFMATKAQVGINTTNPQGAFHVDAKGDTGSNGAKSTDDVIVTNTGNVGIGTSVPTEKLQVVGDVKINGNVDSKGSYDANSASVDGKIGLGKNANNPQATLDIVTDASSSVKPLKFISAPGVKGQYLATDAEGNAYWTDLVIDTKIVGMDASGVLKPMVDPLDAPIQVSTGVVSNNSNYQLISRKTPLTLTKGKWIILAKFAVENTKTVTNKQGFNGTDMLLWTRLRSIDINNAGDVKVETVYGFRPELAGTNIVTPNFTHLVELKSDRVFYVEAFLATDEVYKTTTNPLFGGSYFCAVRLDDN